MRVGTKYSRTCIEGTAACNKTEKRQSQKTVLDLALCCSSSVPLNDANCPQTWWMYWTKMFCFFFSPQNSCCLKEDYLHPSRDPSFNYQESFPSVATSETHVLVLARRKESGKLYSQTTTTFVYSTARWIAQLASKLSRTTQHCFDHNKDRLVRVAKYHKEEQYWSRLREGVRWERWLGGRAERIKTIGL